MSTRQRLATDMITLTISSSLPQFTQFLLERCGIEGNILTVDEAHAFGFGLRRAARAPRAYHAGCYGQLLATYLLTSPAPGRR